MKQKSSWLDGILKKAKRTNKRVIKRTVRGGNGPAVKSFFDYRTFLRSRLFNVSLMIVAGYMIFLTGREALANYYQSKQIAKIETENKTIEQKNEELKYLLEYYKTETFAELEARRYLNLKKPGESVAIVPVDMNEMPVDEGQQPPELKARPNYKKWIDFIFADISSLPDN